MTKISKKVLDKDIEARMFEIFWEAFVGVKTPQEIQQFLNSFISDVEHIMLAKRFGIALMLAKNYSYEEIQNVLKVSSSTIMNVAIRYKIGKGGTTPAIQRMIRQEKTENLMDNIEEFLIMLAGPAKTGSSRHEARVEAGKAIYKRRKKRTLL